MADSMYICERGGHCVDCPLINSNEEPCEYVVEVVPVVHGRWEEQTNLSRFDFRRRCSVCQKGSDLATDYCPNCGAKMDLGG